MHFKTEDIEFNQYCKKYYLKPTAIPSVFDCWNDIPHLNKPIPTHRRILGRRGSADPQIKCNRTTPLAAISLNVSEENKEPSVLSQDSCTNDSHSNNTELDKYKELEDRYNVLLEKCNQLQGANSQLEKNLEKASFSVDSIPKDAIPFYTGFPNKQVFEDVLEYLNPGEKGENITYVRNTIKQPNEYTVPKAGRPRKLKPRNEFFLFLCRLRLGLLETDLAHRFNISIGTVSNIFLSWGNFVYLRLGSLDIWPTREVIDKTMPISFCEKYPTTRVIIDATEIKVEMPSSLMLQSHTYSNYKSTNTLKGLVGISPSGSVTFLSQLYTGNISDCELTERCGILNLPFAPNDSIMADKGFDIQHLLDPINVKINIPPFLKMNSQMSAAEVAQTQQIASERIHAERAINKIKKFHLFDRVIPLFLAGTVNQIWNVCALLILFQKPIIS